MRKVLWTFLNWKKTECSPTLRCVLQLRISRPQWVFFNGVKGQTGVIVQSDPSISINGSLLLCQMVDPTIARVDLNKRHVRDLAPVSGETNGARHNKRVLPLLN